MRYLAILACLVWLGATTARAGVVTYSGTDAQTGTSYGVTIETDDPQAWLFGQYGYLDIALDVDGETYALTELIYSFGASVYVSPYGFTLSGNAVTLTLPNARGSGLARLTLTYAEAYSGALTVAGLLAYLVETELTGVAGFRRNGRELFDFSIEPIPVPVPGGLALFGTGLAMFAGRRRLVELGGIEPPTS